MILSDFDKNPFKGNLKGGAPHTCDVYSKGTGPSILLIQELPGLEVRTEELANRLIDAGFRVHLPLILGDLGVHDGGKHFRLACISHAFWMLSANAASPIVDWLRDLCAEIQKRDSTDRIGVIGMCLSGNFALALMAEEGVVAAVGSQPGMFGLHMTQDEAAAARDGMKAKGCAIAMRYRGDYLSPERRMRRFENFFQETLKTHRFDKRKSWYENEHSLLTHDFNEEAYDTMLSYLQDRLSP